MNDVYKKTFLSKWEIHMKSAMEVKKMQQKKKAKGR